MTKRSNLETLFAAIGCDDFRWMDPGNIILGRWVRMKCQFGCGDYGKVAPCPPNLPPIEECERFFKEYKTAAIFRFSKKVKRPEERHDWTRKINAKLLKLERSVFLAGYYQAFVLYIDPCNICQDCPPKAEDCKHPKNARPSLEGLAVDVFATVRKCGFPINVLTDTDQEMNRYGMVLVE